MTLWSLGALAEAVCGKCDDASDLPLQGLSIDSRTVENHDLFLALRGDVHDGHAYAASALAKGARAVLVDERGLAAHPLPQGPKVVVHDTFAALQALGRAARSRFEGRAVAVTGSVGKTSTKEMLKHVLSAYGPTHAAVASFNNHWGVPLTLARLPQSCAYGVFEVGMNHTAEIAPLTRMVKPHVAVITAVEPVHIEHFRALSGIADAKGEIFEGLMPGGVAVLPAGHAFEARLRAHALSGAGARVLTFGRDERADVRLVHLAACPDGQDLGMDVCGQRVDVHLPLVGEHMAANVSAVFCVVQAFGLSLSVAAEAIAGLQPVAGRGARFDVPWQGGVLTVLDESYNANPASMRAALRVLAQLPAQGRRVAFLGDMLELGAESEHYHRALGDDLAAMPIDVVHAAGPAMRHLHQALPRSQRGVHAQSADDLQGLLPELLQKDDVVMIKGSNGSRMWSLVKSLRTLQST